MGTSLLFKYGFGSGKKRVAIRAMSCKWFEIFSRAKDFVGGMHSQIKREAGSQTGTKTSLAKSEISSPLSLLCSETNSSGSYSMSSSASVFSF